MENHNFDLMREQQPAAGDDQNYRDNLLKFLKEDHEEDDQANEDCVRFKLNDSLDTVQIIKGASKIKTVESQAVSDDKSSSLTEGLFRKFDSYFNKIEQSYIISEIISVSCAKEESKKQESQKNNSQQQEKQLTPISEEQTFQPSPFYPQKLNFNSRYSQANHRSQQSFSSSSFFPNKESLPQLHSFLAVGILLLIVLSLIQHSANTSQQYPTTMDVQATINSMMTEREHLKLSLKELELNNTYLRQQIESLQADKGQLKQDKVLLQEEAKELKAELEQASSFIIKEMGNLKIGLTSQ